MNPIKIIEKYYPKGSDLYKILLNHSTSVADKALDIAIKHPELEIDQDFVYEGAMLHDIGIYLTDSAKIECYGEKPYICHGYLGSELLQAEGYPKHALVCERHTGAGLLLSEIIAHDMPIPHREMIPISIEEQVICFADCFYSKTRLGEAKTVKKIEKSLAKYGERSVIQFSDWCKLFLD